MGCCRVLVKYFLFIFNLIITLIGLAVGGIGVYAYISMGSLIAAIKEELPELPVSSLEIITIPIIVLGAIIFLISFFGCCGAVTESRCLLITYTICMIVLAGLKIYPTIFLYQNEAMVVHETEEYVNSLFSNHTNGTEVEGKVGHFLEYTLECCGPNGPQYYEDLSPYAPPTCCGLDIEGININNITIEDIQNNTCMAEEAYPQGCTGIITQEVIWVINLLKGTLIGLIVTEFIVMFCSIYLTRAIGRKNNKKYQRHYY